MMAQQILRVQILEQELNYERNILQIIEMRDKIEKNNKNIEATLKIIYDLQQSEPVHLVEAQRWKTQIAAHNHTIERQKLENMEAEERIKSCKIALIDIEKAKKHYQENLKISIEAHGEQRWLINQ